MNKELFERLSEAKKYESMAIRALLPKEAEAHLSIIEHEMKAIIYECVESILKQKNDKTYEDKEADEEAKNKNAKVKKVIIE